jgi:hypothetical protein
MFLFRLVTLTVLGSAALSPLAAQGIPRGARASQQAVNAAPRFMVANPFAFASADSAPSVQIGSGLREEMKGMVGRDYQVVEQAQMNEALKQYGYPVDAILSPRSPLPSPRISRPDSSSAPRSTRPKAASSRSRRAWPG